MIDILTAVLVLAGAFFVFTAALGVARMPDILIRMHASTKAGTLGCGLILVAAAIHFAETAIVARALATIVFLMLTAPVGAQMIGRAAYRTGVPLWSGTVVDELGREPPSGGSGETDEREPREDSGTEDRAPA